MFAKPLTAVGLGGVLYETFQTFPSYGLFVASLGLLLAGVSLWAARTEDADESA